MKSSAYNGVQNSSFSGVIGYKIISMAVVIPRKRPDIRAITRLVPREGNLVQGQSELPIDPALARAASKFISSSQNHYGPAEGLPELRVPLCEKIWRYKGIRLDPSAAPLELLITPGGTGALVSIARTYLQDSCALIFEPYYPYHRYILEQFNATAEAFPLSGNSLEIDFDALRLRCAELKDRASFPLRAIIVCSPANPSGKVFTGEELNSIACICQELDLLCISDEVYEHYVQEGEMASIGSLPGMWDRTIIVNSFSKSWNISGWRLGYCYGPEKLVAPVNVTNNIFYVCSPTPLQRALGQVLVADEDYYTELSRRFKIKYDWASGELEKAGFEVYPSGSSFYIWARIPSGFAGAMALNETMIERAGVAGVPGNAFADSSAWDNHMRLCIARDDDVLYGAIEKIVKLLS